MLQSDNSK